MDSTTPPTLRPWRRWLGWALVLLALLAVLLLYPGMKGRDGAIGAAGFVGFGLVFAGLPVLPMTGAPIVSSTTSYIVAILASGALWFLLGHVSALRATRRAVASWLCQIASGSCSTQPGWG